MTETTPEAMRAFSSPWRSLGRCPRPPRWHPAKWFARRPIPGHHLGVGLAGAAGDDGAHPVAVPSRPTHHTPPFSRFQTGVQLPVGGNGHGVTVGHSAICVTPYPLASEAGLVDADLRHGDNWAVGDPHQCGQRGERFGQSGTRYRARPAAGGPFGFRLPVREDDLSRRGSFFEPQSEVSKNGAHNERRR